MADFKYLGYAVVDDGVIQRFQVMQPAPGQETDLYVKTTDAEVPANLNQTQLRSLFATKIGRKVNGIAPLDAALAGAGMTVTI